MEKVRIAIQKSGRLSEKSVELMAEAGIDLGKDNRKLISLANNFPVEAIFLRDDDIPQYVYDGVADLGIVGENVVAEKGIDVDIIEKLGFANCRMSLAIPKTEEYTGLDYFNGKWIATTYPRILGNFLKENKINAEIHVISGSVEIAPSIGLAECIFDIVSSGSTLISNGLKEVEVVMQSQSVLIATKKLTPAKQKTINDLLFRFKAVQRSRSYKYILLNAPNENIDNIIRLIPGMKSPTIMPLAKEGWSSLHSVIKEDDFWDVIDKLKENGAEGILVIPIEKMIM